MTKRRFTFGRSGLLLWGALGLMWPGPAVSDARAVQPGGTAEAAGEPANPAAIDNEPAVPPIDAAAPAVFETASFGLG